jgi:alginate O-acetyltransferase complex protein AlgI
MLFDSPVYFVFLIPVVLAYWRLSHHAQNIFLLMASYFFYAWWDWRFLALMIGATTADFLIAHKVVPGQSDSKRKRWLIFSLVLNLTILGIFKYFDFFVDSFAGLLDGIGFHHIPLPLIRIILPPGISFYTFEEIAYIVDVYKGRVEPSKSFLDYSLFISLFPHLIAGPIQRPGSLLPQIQKQRSLDADEFFGGLMLIFSGLIRKCVVADNCGLLANMAFSGQWGPPNLWVVLIGVYAFAWQVYGDFSGYTDIARGSAQLLGFHFMINFRQPFLSQSMQEIWQRWHISLGTWLRDYLYIPLGGSRGSNGKTCRNLLTTMVLGGLWHGANWTYVVWGAIQGAVMSVERSFFPSKKQEAEAVPPGFPAFLSIWGRRILTFNMWCLTLIFFRSPSLTSAVTLLGGLFRYDWRSEYAAALTMLCAFSMPLFLVDLLLESRNEEYPLAEAPYAVRTALAVVAIVVLAIFSGSKPSTFIYFQF